LWPLRPFRCNDEESIGDNSVKKQQERPVLITNAAQSPSDQLRSRQIRYLSMMGLRAVCLILGAVLISVKPPLLPLWLILCALGMVFLPWAAVMIANDRPAKTKAERQAAAAPKPTPTVVEQCSAEEIKRRTIDAED
jgi:arginine exporter protein ArgO